MSGVDQAEKLPRRHDLDWLRVLVILFVFIYHVGLIFQGTWVISNEETNQRVGQALGLSSFLRMPVLFFIAGAGTWYLFRRRTAITSLGDRLLRLGVPLVIGFLLLLPVQDFFVQIHYQGEVRSIQTVWTDFLRNALPWINSYWSHLWFIAYLLLFSIVAAPLFSYARTEQGRERIDRLIHRVNGPVSILVFAVPLAVAQWSLAWRWPEGWALVDDWARVSMFFLLFVYGYLLFGSERFWEVVDRYKGWMLGLGIVTLGMYVGLQLTFDGAEQNLLSLPYTLLAILTAVNSWVWIIAIVGYARQYLSFENPVLRYSRDASYPFYILHHPIVIAIGVMVVPLSIHPVLKFIIIGTVGFTLTLVAYEYLIRRRTLTRFAMGLKT